VVNLASAINNFKSDFELQRNVYKADSGSTFWKNVDSKLAEIREKAGTGSDKDKRIAK
jgi:hypothetical protein